MLGLVVGEVKLAVLVAQLVDAAAGETVISSNSSAGGALGIASTLTASAPATGQRPSHPVGLGGRRRLGSGRLRVAGHQKLIWFFLLRQTSMVTVG